jgi:hypothetical protein
VRPSRTSTVQQDGRESARTAGFDVSILQLALPVLTGWLVREEREVLRYPIEENRLLAPPAAGRCLRMWGRRRADRVLQLTPPKAAICGVPEWSGARVQRRDRLGGAIHEYACAAYFCTLHGSASRQ